jgi:hypothetical protein
MMVVAVEVDNCMLVVVAAFEFQPRRVLYSTGTAISLKRLVYPT